MRKTERVTVGKVTYIHPEGKPLSRDQLERMAWKIWPGPHNAAWIDSLPDEALRQTVDVAIMYPDIVRQPITLAQLEAGENDPALGQPMPDAPSVRQYDGNLDVEMHFGQPSTPLLHLDEFDVWPPDQNQSGADQDASDLPVIMACGLITALVIVGVFAVALLASISGLPEFLAHLISTLINHIK